MARCSVFQCINGRIKKGIQRTDKVVYHKFPKCPKYAALWWQATKRRRTKPCKSDFICSEHFTRAFYIRDLQHELLGLLPRKRLKADAIPTVNLPSVSQGAIKNNKLTLLPPRKRGRPKSGLIYQDYIKHTKKEIEDIDDIADASRLQHGVNKSIMTKESFPYQEDSAKINDISDFPQYENISQKLQNDSHCQNLLQSMFLDETLMDVVLIAEEKVVKAHRAVLRQASGYFKQILSLDLTVESELTLNNIEYEDLKNIINFIYLGEVSVQSSDLHQFLKTAEMLDIHSLFPWSEEKEDTDSVRGSPEVIEEFSNGISERDRDSYLYNSSSEDYPEYAKDASTSVVPADPEIEKIHSESSNYGKIESMNNSSRLFKRYSDVFDNNNKNFNPLIAEPVKDFYSNDSQSSDSCNRFSSSVFTLKLLPNTSGHIPSSS